MMLDEERQGQVCWKEYNQEKVGHFLMIISPVYQESTTIPSFGVINNKVLKYLKQEKKRLHAKVIKLREEGMFFHSFCEASLNLKQTLVSLQELVLSPSLL